MHAIEWEVFSSVSLWIDGVRNDSSLTNLHMWVDI